MGIDDVRDCIWLLCGHTWQDPFFSEKVEEWTVEQNFLKYMFEFQVIFENDQWREIHEKVINNDQSLLVSQVYFNQVMIDHIY